VCVTHRFLVWEPFSAAQLVDLWRHLLTMARLGHPDGSKILTRTHTHTHAHTHKAWLDTSLYPRITSSGDVRYDSNSLTHTHTHTRRDVRTHRPTQLLFVRSVIIAMERKWMQVSKEKLMTKSKSMFAVREADYRTWLKLNNKTFLYVIYIIYISYLYLIFMLVSSQWGKAK